VTGTVNISRDIWHDAAFKDQPFTEREAFVWLIMEASWKDREKRVGNVAVSLKRGQLVASVRFMAEAWKWQKSTVDRFLKRLEKRDMIGTSSGTGMNVVTICKYDEYQNGPNRSGTPKNADAGHQRDTSGTNEKKGLIPDASPKVTVPAIADRFEEFWAVYPHRGGSKKGKAPTRAKYLAAVKRGVPEQAIIDGAARYGIDRQVVQGFAKNPETWINQVGWDDEIEPTQPQLKAITGGRQDDRRQFAEAHREYTRRLASGAIDLGPDESDPFAR
jgi:hypothetical protein